MNGSSTNVIRRIEKHSRYQGKETNLTKSSVIGILDKLGRYFDDKFNEILYQLTKENERLSKKIRKNQHIIFDVKITKDNTLQQYDCVTDRRNHSRYKK